uniref:Uncharacterized protein n=1 Tax=Sphaerodactylus townsendi TaxID=933632 RepID=A0ACB8G7F1_9SAUR
MDPELEQLLPVILALLSNLHSLVWAALSTSDRFLDLLSQSWETLPPPVSSGRHGQQGMAFAAASCNHVDPLAFPAGPSGPGVQHRTPPPPHQASLQQCLDLLTRQFRHLEGLERRLYTQDRRLRALQRQAAVRQVEAGPAPEERATVGAAPESQHDSPLPSTE